MSTVLDTTDSNCVAVLFMAVNVGWMQYFPLDAQDFIQSLYNQARRKGSLSERQKECLVRTFDKWSKRVPLAFATMTTPSDCFPRSYRELG